ncbi:DUF3899 domain-containing protein [Metabacillus sp. RGM 3146]|uniref:DUF3899 domain-containing protein n=1 Tax=Metabacillus sp. RGM 3146 TaxID=3401092 RepID=UPI003B9CEA28
MKKSIRLFLIAFLLTFIVSLVRYHSITFLYFINISFVISFALLFCGLFVYVTQGGFFDAITYGFRRVFQSQGKELAKEEVNEMQSLSELISLDYHPLLISGGALAVIMLICLGIYYI